MNIKTPRWADELKLQPFGGELNFQVFIIAVIISFGLICGCELFASILNVVQTFLLLLLAFFLNTKIGTIAARIKHESGISYSHMFWSRSTQPLPDRINRDKSNNKYCGVAV